MLEVILSLLSAKSLVQVLRGHVNMRADDQRRRKKRLLLEFHNLMIAFEFRNFLSSIVDLIENVTERKKCQTSTHHSVRKRLNCAHLNAATIMFMNTTIASNKYMVMNIGVSQIPGSQFLPSSWHSVISSG